MVVLKQKQAVLETSKPKNVGKYMVLAFKGLQSHVKCMLLALSRLQKRWEIHGFGFQKPTKSCKMHRFGLIKARKHCKSYGFGLHTATKPCNIHGFGLLKAHIPKADIQITICQRRMSKLPYAKGGCPNYHMPKADVQRGSAAIAVAGKFHKSAVVPRSRSVLWHRFSSHNPCSPQTTSCVGASSKGRSVPGFRAGFREQAVLRTMSRVSNGSRGLRQLAQVAGRCEPLAVPIQGSISITGITPAWQGDVDVVGYLHYHVRGPRVQKPRLSLGWPLLVPRHQSLG